MGIGVCLTNERETGSSRTGFDDVERFEERASCDRFPRMLISEISRMLLPVIREVSGLPRLPIVSQLDPRPF